MAEFEGTSAVGYDAQGNLAYAGSSSDYTPIETYYFHNALVRQHGEKKLKQAISSIRGPLPQQLADLLEE